MKTAFNIGSLDDISFFRQEDYFVWGGSVIHCLDDRYRMFYSRWPKSSKYSFESWVIDSEIACAVADEANGPYTFEYLVLPRRGDGYWDGWCTHNPNIIEHDGKYYLYYMGNKLLEDPPLPEFSEWWRQCRDIEAKVDDGVLKDGPNVSSETWQDAFGSSELDPSEAAFAFWWNHRTHQRIGVAVADSPTGPWQRLETPVLIAVERHLLLRFYFC